MTRFLTTGSPTLPTPFLPEYYRVIQEGLISQLPYRWQHREEISLCYPAAAHDAYPQDPRLPRDPAYWQPRHKGWAHKRGTSPGSSEPHGRFQDGCYRPSR